MSWRIIFAWKPKSPLEAPVTHTPPVLEDVSHLRPAQSCDPLDQQQEVEVISSWEDLLTRLALGLSITRMQPVAR